jgi:hypothetical protein
MKFNKIFLGMIFAIGLILLSTGGSAVPMNNWLEITEVVQDGDNWLFYLGDMDSADTMGTEIPTGLDSCATKAFVSGDHEFCFISIVRETSGFSWLRFSIDGTAYKSEEFEGTGSTMPYGEIFSNDDFMIDLDFGVLEVKSKHSCGPESIYDLEKKGCFSTPETRGGVNAESEEVLPTGIPHECCDWDNLNMYKDNMNSWRNQAEMYMIGFYILLAATIILAILLFYSKQGKKKKR